MHSGPHQVYGPEQSQTPLPPSPGMHEPEVQKLPQPPQLKASEVGSMHEFWQQMRPASGEQFGTHWQPPAAQSFPVGQAKVHEPQLEGSDSRSVQSWPPSDSGHSARWQAQTPPPQASPDGQAFPQAPQF